MTMDWRQLHILHEDNHLLAIAKPACILVQGDRTGHPTLLDLARDYIKHRYYKPGNVYLGLVHRLDRPVSGIVLLARTSKAASRVARQFREGTVRKLYLAVVQGTVAPKDDELVHYLARSGDERGVTRAGTMAFKNSRLAMLRYHVIGSAAGRSLLEIDLVTGRRHQIRSQLALAGWPVLGDVKYGAHPMPQRPGIALHAWRLEVAHPIGGQTLSLVASPPGDWPWLDILETP